MQELGTILGPQNRTQECCKPLSKSIDAMIEEFYLKEKKRAGEMAIAEELQRKQMEIETILNKKREEEHLKRLEFEEERIKVILDFLF